MKVFLQIVNIIFGIILVVLILIQGRGAGLGSAWGGGSELFQTRRGLEKLTMTLTVIFIISFFIVSLINLFL
jgi:protein translocase SecG subunit